MKDIKLPSNSVHYRKKRKKKLKHKITLERLELILFALIVIAAILLIIFLKF